jgi:hypothetical protein
VARKRRSDRHPASLRSVRDLDGQSNGRHLYAVPDPPRALPPLIAGDDEDPGVDPVEVLSMSLSMEQWQYLGDNDISLRDVYDGKVPGLDPDEIVAKAMEETGSHNGPWSPME